MAIQGIIGAAMAAKNLADMLTKKKSSNSSDEGGLSKLELGLGLAGGLLGGMQQAGVARDQLKEQRRQFDASQAQRQAEQTLAAIQMNPFMQQEARQRQAMAEAMLKGMSPTSYSGGKFSGGLQSLLASGLDKQIGSFFTPSARQAAEGQFAGAANAASAGRYGTPNYASLGYGPMTAVPSVSTAPTTDFSSVLDQYRTRRPWSRFEGEEPEGMEY